MDLELRGRTALITGASQGIGAGIAEVLAREGCRLRLTARSADKLEAVAAALRDRFGVEVEIHAADLVNLDVIPALAAWAGPVDILVNNAGALIPGRVTDVGDADWLACFNLKLFAAVALTRELYPAMKARGEGAIINNIGILADRPSHNHVIGSTMCAALQAFTRAAGGGSLDEGIRVIGISPGAVATPLMTEFLGESGLAQFPGSRAASVEEVGELVAFLASRKAAYLSGTVVTIDGGLSAQSTLD